MKTLFIEARYSGKTEFRNIRTAELPKRVGLVASVQFVSHLPALKGFLAERHKVMIGRGRQKHAGQVLGCDASAASAVKGAVDAFLYLGDGKFHPIAVAIDTGKPVFCFNPISRDFRQLDSREVERYKKRKKGALLRFLNADVVGIILSTKSGQRTSEKLVEELERKYPGKRFYRFLCDTLDFGQLSNFPFIKAWVNTACPRLDEDFGCLNLQELQRA
jgi:2-(3-amino-3-carboxypropyl)histidine synthase